MRPSLVCILAVIAFCISPVFAEGNINGIDFLTILSKYGILDYKNVTVEEISEAVREFQVDHKLQSTGLLNDETLQKMDEVKNQTKPINKQNGMQSPEYQIVSKWSKNFITWKLTKFSKTSSLTRSQQRGAITRAFQRWTDVSPLVFKETTNEADIEFSFENEYHPRFHRFHHQSIAHAFYPPKNDEGIHFWDKRKWTLGGRNTKGYNLEVTATHEIGHALGLNHSSHYSAVMYEYIKRYPINFTLSPDDIAGIQANYGTKPPQPSPATTVRRSTTPKPTNGNAISDTSILWNNSYRTIDAAFRISGDVFLFVDGTFIIDGRTRQKMDMVDLFPSGPYFVQAAVYSKQDNRVYLFKNESVWAYSFHSTGRFYLVNGYPKNLLNSHTHNLESVLMFEYSNREILILFKNRLFMYYYPGYESAKRVMTHIALATFINIPKKLDAAISCDFEIFFIVNNEAYRMAKDTRMVDTVSIPVNEAVNICQN